MAGRQAVDLVKTTGEADAGHVVFVLLMLLRVMIHAELIMTVFDAVTDAGQAAQMMMGS